jgi:hypothetical protein
MLAVKEEASRRAAPGYLRLALARALDESGNSLSAAPGALESEAALSLKILCAAAKSWRGFETLSHFSSAVAGEWIRRQIVFPRPNLCRGGFDSP